MTLPIKAPASRLTSLDALRGFTMLWIVGADSIGYALSHLQGGAWLKAIAAQFDHAPWAGLHFYDLIMPLFLFMVGAAIPFSMDRMLAESATRAPAIWRILRRTLLLFALGVIYYGAFGHESGQLRLAGTLQRIAVCYCAASMFYLSRPRPLTIAAVCATILIGYWAVLALVPVPGFGAGDYAEGHNIANGFDAHFLPGRKWDGDHDPEGLLGTFCAIVTTLLGVLAGKYLRRPDRTPGQKAIGLAIAGLVLIVIGLLWAIPVPVIKKIWTPSYAVLTGGISLFFLAGFYWVIDVRASKRIHNPPAWAMPFVWLGTNALTIYMISNIVDFGALTRRVIGGPVAQALDAIWPGLSGLLVALVSIVLCVLLCRFLYNRKIFLKL